MSWHDFVLGKTYSKLAVVEACEAYVGSAGVFDRGGKMLKIQEIRDSKAEDIVFAPQSKGGWGASPLNPNNWRNSAGVPTKSIASARLIESPDGVSANEVIEHELWEIQLAGASFGDPEVNKVVEAEAIRRAAAWYRNEGWMVTSAEREKRGFDLRCEKDTRELHVEVKGIQGTLERFIITANEVRTAESDPNFVLCLVTSALAPEPSMTRLSGQEFLQAFKLEPLAYNATRRSQRA